MPGLLTESFIISAKLRNGPAKLVQVTRIFRIFLYFGFVCSNGLRNLPEIVFPRSRNQLMGLGNGVGNTRFPGPVNKFFFFQQLQESEIKPVGPLVIESVGNDAKNREAFDGIIKFQMTASILFANRIQCVLGPRFIKLVDHDAVGIVDHVDLFQLGRGTIFRGHHINTEICQIGDFGVTLPNPRRFNKDQVKG